MTRVPPDAYSRRNYSTAASPIRIASLHLIGGWLAICLLTVVSGCTTTITTKFTTPTYPTIEPVLDLAVALVITEPFREYVWRHSDLLGLNPVAMPLNGALADNALAATRAVFRNVTLQKEGAASSTRSQRERQAVLTPRVANIMRVPSLPSDNELWWAKVEQTVSIEWTLRTSDDVVVWVGTATGRFTNTQGHNFSFRRKARERLREAVVNAFTNSVKIMADAPEIMEYADK